MARFHIYADESGTHSQEWLIIGMLFVPNHGSLHAALCDAKEKLEYFNRSPKRKARYKETHLVEFRSARDVQVARQWVDLFVKHNCYYRAVVVDWGVWDSKHFGSPFDPEELKKRRAYKKWAEMLLHPELTRPAGGAAIYHARFFLDRLNIMYGYDVLGHLEQRFKQNYEGESPYIDTFDHVNSWRDRHQCLQLCDLLTGCIHQGLTPAQSPHKLAVRDYFLESMKAFGVRSLRPEFWRQYAPNTLNDHFPKFSEWFWRPTKRSKKQKRGSKRTK